MVLKSREIDLKTGFAYYCARSYMIQTDILFNVYCARESLKRELLRCPAFMFSYLGSHSKTKIDNYFSHPLNRL